MNARAFLIRCLVGALPIFAISVSAHAQMKVDPKLPEYKAVKSASGTYGYFKDKALFRGDFRDEVKEQPRSTSVVQRVGRDK
jgi:hypothetical protein